VDLVKPKLAIPMHYKTFDVIDVDPDEFATKVRASGGEARVLGINESIEF
ncbi:MAG: metal-dependent hydrolase, partial [Gammaproteobacteria bacterium]|nr:metal-dependent hydrolase [Gammaproteobacteria bacterium]